jgi:hypothetical protein
VARAWQVSGKKGSDKKVGMTRQGRGQDMTRKRQEMVTQINLITPNNPKNPNYTLNKANKHNNSNKPNKTL